MQPTQFISELHMTVDDIRILQSIISFPIFLSNHSNTVFFEPSHLHIEVALLV